MEILSCLGDLVGEVGDQTDVGWGVIVWCIPREQCVPVILFPVRRRWLLWHAPTHRPNHQRGGTRRRATPCSPSRFPALYLNDGRGYVVVEGVGDDELAKGPGHYPSCDRLFRPPLRQGTLFC